MKSIPFFIGFVIVIPVTNVFALSDSRRPRRIGGHGVGALLYAGQAIQHEAIKDNISTEARLFWVTTSEAVDPVSRRAIDVIMGNVRYVSIANAWYRVPPAAMTEGAVDENRIEPVMPQNLCRTAASGGLLVTLFGEESGMLGEGGDDTSSEMAIVVERYAGCRSGGLTAIGGPLCGLHQPSTHNKFLISF